MTNCQTLQMPPHLKVAFLLMLLPLSLAGCSDPKSQPVSPAKTLDLAKDALQESDFTQVEQLVADIPEDSDEWQQAMLVAGEAATKSGHTSRAIEHYLAAAEKEETSPDGLLAWLLHRTCHHR